MSIATYRRQADKLTAELRGLTAAQSPTLEALRQEPASVFQAAGLCPDPWQQDLLTCADDRLMILASRQVGKSTATAALALAHALTRPGALVLLLSPSERQSGELAAKVFDFYDALGQPVAARKRTELQLHLVNRSRVVALPGNEKTVRGYSGATLLVVDEASRVPDALYYAVRPMLAVSRGRLIVLSTPFGKSGFFHQEWSAGTGWKKVLVPATACARLTPEFLADERQKMGPRWYRQEYFCSFEDDIAAVFAHADIQAALSGDVRPLFAASRPSAPAGWEQTLSGDVPLLIPALPRGAHA